jgi:ribonucleoside-diphosphate reductase alpha chain
MLQPTPQDSAVNPTEPDLSTIAVDGGKKLKVESGPPPKMHTYDEVFEATLEYFSGDKLAATTWIGKYALKHPDGDYVEKTPEDMHRRLAKEFARMEAKYPNPMGEEEIFQLLKDWTIVPQGSPMSGVGNPYKLQSVSNCFVVQAPEDSYGGILHTDQRQAQIMKRRGGVGFDISTIRPQGLPTLNAAQTTDGIGIFMERFSNTCREVAQGGRRGALMLSCDVHHPEILTFVRIKNTLTACKACGFEYRTKVQGANVSVRLSDEFLEAVDKGEKYQLRWPVDVKEKPTVEHWVDAREVWGEIMQHARDSAEPGLLFWDRILRESPADCYADVGYATKSTNPCAELPLSPGDSCRLLVVNLAKFVIDPFTDDAKFDFERFHEVSMKAQRLMDDLVDLELEQIDKILDKVENDSESPRVKLVEQELWTEIREAAANGRRTGTGVTAVGDAVAMMGHRYGDDASLDFVENMYKGLALASYESSIDMAAERGCFPVYNFNKEKDHPYLERILEAGGLDLRKKYETHGRRNIANLTTAPTGSVSIMTQTTGGIEPVFKALYVRRKKVNPNDEGVRVDDTDTDGTQWTNFTVRHHGLVKWQEVTGKGDDAFEESPYYGAEAEAIDWKQRVKLQARAGQWIDHSISSTVNLPKDVATDTVREIYEAAYHAGCKGITVYRDTARDGGLVDARTFHQHDAPKRSEVLQCEVHRSRIKKIKPDGEDLYEDWLIFVGLMEGKPYEVFGGTTENIVLPRKIEGGTIVKRSFAKGGKYDFVYGDDDDPLKILDITRQFLNADRKWGTRMISTSLRHGTPVEIVVEQLSREKDAELYDFGKVLARVLKKYIPDGVTAKAQKVCDNPDCGVEGELFYQEGCVRCNACGNSKCG